MRALKLGFILLVVLSFFKLPTVLAKEPPNQLLERLTQEMISTLKREDARLKRNPEYIYTIVERSLVPYIDWYTMSQWVIGKNAWQHATEPQRKRFANEFKTLLIRTYSTTLRSYNNQVVEYVPLRSDISGKKRVQIASFIKEPGKKPIQVTYRLVDKGETWKVYDISIEGVSLLKGFKSQFAQEVQQSGLEALTNRLQTHNSKPLT